MLDVFSLNGIIEYLIVAIIMSLLMGLCSFKPFGVLQQCGYKTKMFLSWAGRKNNMAFTRLVLLSFMLVLFSAITTLCFSFLGIISAYLSLIPFVGFFILYYYADSKIALKVKLKITGRVRRLYATLIILLILFIFLLGVIFNLLVNIVDVDIIYNFKYVPLGVLPLFLPSSIALANIINSAIENPKNKKFIVKATDKLAKTDIKKIAITGSYAKTTIKNILFTILSEKYSIVCTPESYNTPLGIAKTINKNDLSCYDYIIVEMGAKNKGDIKELCDMVQPDYSIITGICPQHLESFETLENIISTKSEIIEGTSKDGFIVVGADENTKNIFKDIQQDKLLVPSKDLIIKGVKSSTEGIKFSYNTKGEVYNFESKLLGEHNARNIAICVEMAKKLGLSKEEIERGVKKVNHIPHRLEKIVSNGISIIDDSYNASINGVYAALNVLKLFGGKKIVVTPGVVELGVLEEEVNRKLGEQLSDVDLLILVGETLVQIIKEGALSNGMSVDKIKVVPTLEHTKEIIQEYVEKGDTLLFLNDLPDIYN